MQCEPVDDDTLALFTIMPEAIDEHWGLVGPLLEEFERETGTASAEEIKDQARNGLSQVWGLATPAGVRGVCVTRVHVTPRNRFCSIWVAQGSNVFGDLLRVYDAIETWAQSVGCTAMHIHGRRGWKRILPGYREVAVVLEKSLVGVKH